MSHYPYNYRPTNDEINQAWELLSKVAKPELMFHVYNEDEDLGNISSLIRSMGNFNEKDADKVGCGFTAFFKDLPRAYYNEGNPNNGRPLFDEVILHGDDYIILQAHGFANNMEKYDWKEVDRLVDRIGNRWNADVATVMAEELNYGMVQYTIKFWWD